MQSYVAWQVWYFCLITCLNQSGVSWKCSLCSTPSTAEGCEAVKLQDLTADGSWEVSSDSCLTARVLHSVESPFTSNYQRPRPELWSHARMHTHMQPHTHAHTQSQTNYRHLGDASSSMWSTGEHLTHCCPLILTSTLPVTPCCQPTSHPHPIPLSHSRFSPLVTTSLTSWSSTMLKSPFWS